MFNVCHSSLVNTCTMLALISEIRRFDRREHLVQIIVIYWWTTHHTYRRAWESEGVWWRHDMEILSALLVPCEGNHRSLVDSPHNGSVMRSFYVSLNKLNKQWSCRWFQTLQHSSDIILNHQHQLLCSPCYRIENAIGITLVSGHTNGYWSIGQVIIDPSR